MKTIFDNVNINKQRIYKFYSSAGRKMDMASWIPFVEGEYIVEQAFIIAPDDRAVAIENAVVEVYTAPGGDRRLKGSGRLRNILLVELLEVSDDLELVLDLGEEFKYRLIKPDFQAGKFFSPDAKSTVQFRPSVPWKHISQADFERLMSRLTILDV